MTRRRSRTALLACLAAVLTTGALGTPASNAAPPQQAHNDPVTPAESPASAYTAVAPARVLDTRNGTGGTLGPVGPNSTVTLDLSARVPVTATAVVINVTGTEATAPTYVTVFPHGAGRPTASNLNLVPGRTRPNLVTVATSADRRVALYNHAGSVHLIADLAGYYSTTSGSRFTTLEPHRVYDTHWYSAVGPGGTVTVDLSHAVPTSATAVTFNLTATEPTATTYVTAWPTGAPRPTASNVNVVAGETAPNLVTVAIGGGRKVNLFNHSGSVHLIADLAGFYTPDYGALFTAVTPTRIVDTRDGTGTPGGAPNPVGPHTSLPVNPGDRLPDGAVGAVVNLTGIAPTATTFVTAWQDTNIYGPSTSNLNLTPGLTAANLAVIETGWSNPYSRFYLYNRAGHVHLAGDLAGYFWVPQTSCASGCVYSWGSNHYGGLGIGVTSTYVPVPSPVAGLSNVVAVDARYAVRSDGTVWAWGLNQSGQLGNGWYGSGSTVPVPVLGLTGAVSTAGSGVGGYALRSDGSVWAWGSNADGQLGNGGFDNATTPVRVPSLSGITAIAAGSATAYALRNDGTVWSWGLNDDGQLGNGSTAALSRVPVQVTGLTGVVAVASGGRSAYALRSNGTVWSWGRNDRSQLGNGTVGGPSRVPVQVSGLTGATDIAGSFDNGFAARNDGTVWSWGDNFLGNLGNGVECSGYPDGTGCRSALPVQVTGLTNVTMVGAHGYGGYALNADGALWAWGSNQSGELGDPDVRSHSTVPVRVTRLSGVAAIDGSFGGRALVPDPG